jgi:hypothetical protein
MDIPNLQAVMIAVVSRPPPLSGRILPHNKWLVEERLPLFPVVTPGASGSGLSRGSMPIFKYFVLVGGCLLALLFATDRYLPRPVERASAADVDRSIIRIQTARVGPERVEFDTAQPPRPPAIQAGQDGDLPRESYAMMPKSDPWPAQTGPIARDAHRVRATHAYRRVRRPQERLIALDPLQLSAW